MSVSTGKGVYEIIRRTLAMVNRPIIEHGERTGYILYKMLECENKYSKDELFNFVMIGMLHNIGLYRENNIKSLEDFHEALAGPHSVIGCLFMKYLSPLGDLANAVVYHHIDYEIIKDRDIDNSHLVECLSFANQMERFISQNDKKMEKDYFTKYRGIKFSEAAHMAYSKAEEKFDVIKKLGDDTYRDELYEFLDGHKISEQHRLAYFHMLVYAIDFRSESTVIHTMATVNFAQQLGKLLNLSNKEMYDLYYGALLHDLGKLAVPIEILESPNRLSEAEMDIMKSHVKITELILDTVVDDEIRDIAARHHEKLDGSGYPRGLKDVDLTFPQQILAVADIMSALYGKRSYKDSYEAGYIKKIINDQADEGKINKRAVNCLLDNYDEIVANYEREKEDLIGTYMMIKAQYDLTIEKFEKASD